MNRITVGNSRYIRDLNLTAIFRLIHQYGPISRKELSENTGYSAATISNHVKRLIDAGYVIETEKGDSTGGRKPIYLTVNPEKGYIFAVDIEVKQVKLIMFNLKLEIEQQDSFSILDSDTPQGIVERTQRLIKKTLALYGLVLDDILGIGIAVPGLVNQEKDILEFAPNLGWQKVDIIQALKRKYQFPIVLENEARAAAIGEKEFVYPQINNMVFVSINEGIGCGIIFGGKIYRGASGNAGEFGHIIIDEDGPECHCGNNGCWETLASENFMINSYLKQNNKLLSKEKLYQLAKQRDKEDKELIKIIKKTGNNIGVGLVNIINSLSPELLVIGGDIIRIKDQLQPEILKVLQDKAMTASYQKTKIEFSKLGNLATAYGLAQLVFEKNIYYI